MYKPNAYLAVVTGIILAIVWAVPVEANDKPEIMLAKVFHPSIDVTEYWISEKLDGVRARWNGRQLISRGGKIFAAPDWFSIDFPELPMDGELWIARGKYQKTAALVRKQNPHDGWKQVRFMVFDLPAHPGIFSKRVAFMRNLIEQNNSRYLSFITQFRVVSSEELLRQLSTITDLGGEGLMLHHENALYHRGRSNNLLKLKPYSDAEAQIIGYRTGQGQFMGKMGAIKVRIQNGKEFFIGSGFSHHERENPPSIGSIVTFRHQGLTDKGIPRFAVFLRMRDQP